MFKAKEIKINGKILSKDFGTNECKIKIVEKRVKFNSLRFLYFRNIIQIIKSFKPREIIIHNDPISLQVFILIIYSFFQKYSIYCMSNENNVITNKNKFNSSKVSRAIILLFLNLFIKNKIKKFFVFLIILRKIMIFLVIKKKPFYSLLVLIKKFLK